MTRRTCATAAALRRDARHAVINGAIHDGLTVRRFQDLTAAVRLHEYNFYHGGDARVATSK